MTQTQTTSLWAELEAGNIWWPSYKPGRDPVLTWRHAAAILMRDVDPEPIFAALPAAFEGMYELTADEVCEQRRVPDGNVLWPVWPESWVSHFDHWHDPIRQLVEQHCTTPDAQVIAGILRSLRCASTADDPLPIVQAIANAAPFERLSYGFYQRFCAELNQEAEPPSTPMSSLDFDRAGTPNIFGGDVT